MKKNLIFVFCLSFFLLGSCGNKESDKTITVMLPPWGEPSSDLLAEFTNETEIQVIMNIVGWDEIRNKLSISSVGNIAPADVIEVDWSWVGEFGKADWFEPFELTQSEIDSMPTISSFVYDNKILALPYANDFRLAYYNTEHFERVGITEPPTTWEELIAACKEIKKQGICEYPISMTLSATEAATTSLLWMTLSKYGDFLEEDITLNKENVLGALETINTLVKRDKLIDPTSQNLKDVEVYGKILTGDASFMIGPTYFVGRINNPEYTSLNGKLEAILVPGNGYNRSATFALPEGIGISKFSENKESALEFVQWYTSPDVQLKLFEEKGLIPTRTLALEKLIASGDLENGEIILEQSSYISSPFPNGLPYYYAEMSNTVYNSVNKMVSGTMTPTDAFTTINAKQNELNSRIQPKK